MKKVVYAVLILAVIAKFGYEMTRSDSPPEFVTSYGNTVVLYATSWCGYCQATRELLEANGIEYLEYDVENSSRGGREFRQLGGRGVPLVLIGGKTVKGYDPDMVLRLAKSL